MRTRDFFVYLLAVGVIIGGGLGMLDAVMNPGPARASEANQPLSVADWFSNPVSGRSRVNLLLMGADHRITPDGYEDPGRSDTIIWVSLCPQTKRASMLSVQRDLLVTLPEAKHSYPQKINAAYAFGGVQLATRTVERELGIRVDYYAKVDLDDFVKVVDLLGGVNLNIPDIEGGGRGMNYDDDWGNLHVALKPGLQHCDGREAMGFVRYRKSNYRSRGGGHLGCTDTQRAEHQQMFLRAIVEQKLKVQKLPSLLRAAGFIMSRLDTNMDWRTMVGLIKVFRGMDSGQIMHASLPIEDKWISGGYYCEVTPEGMRELQDKLDAFLAGALEAGPAPGEAAASTATPAPAAEPARPLRVKVLNGCGKPGAGSRAVRLLEGAAFHLATPQNADSFAYERTVIQYQGRYKAAAAQVARKLGVRDADLQPLSPSAEDNQPDLLVTLGRDFSPREASP